MKNSHPIFAFTLTLTLFACTRTAPVPAFNRDSVVTVLRDSLSQRYGSEEDLNAALWNQRIMIDRPLKDDEIRDDFILIQASAMYASPDSGAKIIANLPAGTKLTPAQAYEVQPRSVYARKFWKVKTADSLEGYLSQFEIARHRYEPPKGGSYSLLVGNCAPRRQYCYCLQVNRFQENPPKIMETLKVDWCSGSHQHLRPIRNLALKNVDMALYFYGTNASCPEYHDIHFIVDANGKLKDALQTYATGEGGYYEHATMYLPVRFENGKILLVREGSDIFDGQEARLINFEYNDSIGIPIEDLVVVVEESAEYDAYVEGAEKYDQQGRMKKKITHHRVKYYCWDGEQLNFVK
jgi:hypothetical protein